MRKGFPYLEKSRDASKKAHGVLKMKVDRTQNIYVHGYIQDNYIKIIEKFKISHREAESHAFCIQPNNI